MATYVNDLRLTELATGEGSGTWGTTTNTNLELIGEALGYGTQDCFASDADATTTIADGVSDPARAMYFKVTSSATLTATRTLTIDPNTVSRVMLIENATTGSQSISISQGSGSNVTIASGQTKMVYLDGAGATGAVVDALADLELGTITVANLTATTADINGGTIDGVTIGGASAGAGTFTNLTATGTTTLAGASTTADITFSDNDKAIFGAGSDLQIYHDGSNSIILDSGTGFLSIRATDLYIGDSGGNTYISAIDNGVGGTVALYHNTVKKLETTATGIDVTGTVTADGLTVDGEAAVTAANNGKVTFRSASASDEIQMHVGTNNTGALNISTRTAANDTDRLKIANNGDISFYEDTGTTAKFFWDASAEKVFLSGTVNNSTRPQLALDGGSGGADRSAGISGLASGTNATDLLFFTNADTDIPTERMRIDYSGNVGIGTSSPSTKLTIADSDAADFLHLSTGNTSGDTYAQIRGDNEAGIRIRGGGSQEGGVIELGGGQRNTDPGVIKFSTGPSGPSSEVMRINTSGNVGIGETAPDASIHISSGDTNGIIQQRNATVTTQARGSLEQRNSNGNSMGGIAFNGGGDNDSGVIKFFVTDDNSGGSSLFSLDLAVQIDSNSDLKFNSGYGSVATAYGCRAWVNFNGTGTVAIRDSGNVSSITDNGTGDYTVNFTTAMPDTNYIPVTAQRQNSLTDGYTSQSDLATSSVNIKYRGASALVDRDLCGVAIFR